MFYKPCQVVESLQGESVKLRISTRKGLFVYEKQGTHWQISQSAFLGDPVTLTMVDPRNGRQYAALDLGHFGVKLRRAEANSWDWQDIAVPTYPKSEAADAPALKLIWALEASNADRPDVLWAGTIPGGLFRSDDGGDSWTLMESLWQREERAQWFGGGYDNPGIHSIMVHPQNSDQLVLAISCGGVWKTSDNGASWEQLGEGLRAAYMPPEQANSPVSQDPHMVRACPAKPEVMWMQHHNGIFHSTDGGHHWCEYEPKPSSFGFAVAVHPTDPQTAWFVPGVKDECRVPVDGALTVTKTQNGGKTFSQQRMGLPQEHAYDIVYRHALDVDASGTTLAFGSTTGNLWISEDGGNHWQQISGNLPPIHAVRFDPV